MTDCFNITSIGERHVIEKTVCQDSSVSMSKDGISIAAVADGHGGPHYSRSDIGAKLAVGVAVKCITAFVDEMDKSIFSGKPLVKYGVARELDEEQKSSELYKQIHSLLASVLYYWELEVQDHVEKNPFTSDELHAFSSEYQDMLKTGYSQDVPYGTTLLACIQTDCFWLAFQIGDGKVLISDKGAWHNPIPDDDNCYDNITTSMCDKHAIDDFRFCFQSDGHFPDAVFLCTDGMEHSFASIDKLTDYYKNILDVVKDGSKELLLKHLKKILPTFSMMTTGDDISVTCIYNNINE